MLSVYILLGHMRESILYTGSQLVLWKLDCLGWNLALLLPRSVAESELPNLSAPQLSPLKMRMMMGPPSRSRCGDSELIYKKHLAQCLAHST